MHSFSNASIAILLFALLTIAQTDAFGVNKGKASAKGRRLNKVIARDELPTLDLTKSEPPVVPEGFSKSEFYLPTYTVLRAGPVAFVRRVLDGGTYEQRVYKYMNDFNEDSLMTAQGNVDAYLGSPDDWAEQKLQEEQGKREVYDYGKALPTDRVILGSIWASFIVVLFTRVIYQLANGKTTIL